jgi:hypothetical protein
MNKKRIILGLAIFIFIGTLAMIGTSIHYDLPFFTIQTISSLVIGWGGLIFAAKKVGLL